MALSDSEIASTFLWRPDQDKIRRCELRKAWAKFWMNLAIQSLTGGLTAFLPLTGGIARSMRATVIEKAIVGAKLETKLPAFLIQASSNIGTDVYNYLVNIGCVLRMSSTESLHVQAPNSNDKNDCQTYEQPAEDLDQRIERLLNHDMLNLIDILRGKAEDSYKWILEGGGTGPNGTCNIKDEQSQRD